MYLILILKSAYAYDYVHEFDMSEDIIYTTTVYNTSNRPCLGCSCNLTIYNPPPNESIIYLSTYLVNKGNGIYSIDLTDNITYNKFAYPIVIVCNDTQYYGGETREAIKIGESVFDYTSLILIVLGIGALFLYSSFVIDKKLWDIKLLLFFGSFGFMFGAVLLGLQIAAIMPNSSDFQAIITVVLSILGGLFIGIMYLYAKHRITSAIERNKTALK